MFSNKKAQLHVIKVIFIALAFFLIFGFLAGSISNSTENFSNTWGQDYPMLAWIVSGLNVWIVIGGLLGIIAMIVFGTEIAD